MTDHHDFGYHDDHEPLPYDDPAPVGHDQHTDEPFDQPDHGDDGWDDHLDLAETHDTLLGDDHADPEVTAPESADDGGEAIAADDPVDVFPPTLNVGDLPEPVDGFPWIDTGSLGVVDPAALPDPADTDPVRPEELAEYAGTDLPPGVDPWAALADSDDPATSALARWWSEN